MMFYLIYLSSATRLLEDHELLSLLEQSRENNLSLGITGMLLYNDGNFMQMLEGEKQTVLDLYDQITKDNRHKHVTKIMERETEERNFENWSMGFRNLDKVGDFPTHHEYIEKNLTSRSFRDDAQDAYEFMLLFNEMNR